MIQIRRPEAPPSILHASTAKDRYRDPLVVGALWKMQFRKCCYCEREIPSEGAEKEVEHFRPKRDYEHLANSWTNLLLACRACNRKKWHEFPLREDGTPLLIDPSDPATDPEERLRFIVDPRADDCGLICARNADEGGRKTIDVVGLARTQHVRRHRKHLGELYKKYFEWLAEDNREGDPERREHLKAELRLFVSAKSPFAGLAREFARELRLDDLLEPQPAADGSMS